jgi:arylsulfatase A-like enzyme
MSIRLPLFFILLFTLSAFGKEAPNVLLILTDDHGYADLPAHGMQDIALPHLDQLTASGVRFTAGYVTGVMCSPSRAGLISGRYQQRFGHENNSCQEALFLSGGKTLAEHLKPAGYRTAMFGKWHLGERKLEHRPKQRGFEESYEYRDYAADAKAGKLCFPGANASPNACNAQVFATKAADFITRHKDQPWFIYLPLHEPHVDVSPTPASAAKAAHISDPLRRGCAAVLADVDEAVGILQQRLHDLSLEENTLIIFHGDNGAPINMDNYPPKGSGFENHRDKAVNGSRNEPLKGRKGLVWEGGIRVPYLMQWKGVLPAGKVYEQPVISLDTTATVLFAAKAKPVDGIKLDGVNLIPYLRGKKPEAPHERLFWRDADRHLWAIRQGRWKLVQDGNWKADASDVNPPQLYDLEVDPGETRDLSAEQPALVAELKAAWTAWDTEMKSPLFDILKNPKTKKKPKH